MAAKDIKVKKKLIEMLQDKDCRVAILAQDCLAEMGSTKEVPDSTYRYIINNEELEYIIIARRELWRKKRNKILENIVLEIIECEDEYRMYKIIDLITPRIIRSEKIKNKMKKAIENGEIKMECVKKRMKDYIREYEHDDKKHKKSIKFDTENAEKN